jgi:hypothetical protein
MPDNNNDILIFTAMSTSNLKPPMFTAECRLYMEIYAYEGSICKEIRATH